MSNGVGGIQDGKAVSTLLNVRQVAEILGIHERTVWRFAAMAEAKQGCFPRPIRIAERTVRWRREDVESYIDSLVGEGRA